MPAVESNASGLWVAKQTAKGTPATVATKKLIQVGGDIALNVDHGSENWSDTDRFGDATDFVNTITGGGSPTIEAQSNEAALLSYLFFGQETFTAKSAGVAPPKFIFEPGSSAGFWSTFWKRVGLSQVVRQKFNDCRITSLRFEGSTANKVVKVIPTILSLDAGEIYAADPAATMNTADPFLYTEGAGRFTIDGVTYSGHSQFAITFDNAEAPYYGDGVRPVDVFAGNAQVTLEAITLALDAASYAQYCKQVYGTAAPAAGTKPIEQLPTVGSYSIDLRKTKDANGVARAVDAVESLKIEIGGVHWTPDQAIAPNPDGGLIELAFGGSMRKNYAGGAPPLAPKIARVTIETGAGDAAAHV